MVSHSRRRPHRGLKVKTQAHCMKTSRISKNIEGDPAKPGLAENLCWTAWRSPSTRVADLLHTIQRNRIRYTRKPLTLLVGRLQKPAPCA
jgi:hypothetical protein